MEKTVRKSYYLNLKLEKDRETYDSIINNFNLQILGFESQFMDNGDYIVFFSTEETVDEGDKSEEED